MWKRFDVFTTSRLSCECFISLTTFEQTVNSIDVAFVFPFKFSRFLLSGNQ